MLNYLLINYIYSFIVVRWLLTKSNEKFYGPGGGAKGGVGVGDTHGRTGAFTRFPAPDDP